jgi:hypothetical protein
MALGGAGVMAILSCGIVCACPDILVQNPGVRIA